MKKTQSDLDAEFLLIKNFAEKHIPEIAGLKQMSWATLMMLVDCIEQNYDYFGKELSLKITKYSVAWQTIDNEAIVLSPVVFHKYGTYAGTEKREAIYESVLDYIRWYNRYGTKI